MCVQVYVYIDLHIIEYVFSTVLENAIKIIEGGTEPHRRYQSVESFILFQTVSL